MEKLSKGDIIFKRTVDALLRAQKYPYITLKYGGVSRKVDLFVSNYAEGVRVASISSVYYIDAPTAQIQRTYQVPDIHQRAVLPTDA